MEKPEDKLERLLDQREQCAKNLIFARDFWRKRPTQKTMSGIDKLKSELSNLDKQIDKLERKLK